MKELIWNSKLFAFCILFFESTGGDGGLISFIRCIHCWGDQGTPPVLLFVSAVIRFTGAYYTIKNKKLEKAWAK